MNKIVFEIARNIRTDFERMGTASSTEHDRIELGIVLGALALSQEILKNANEGA